MGEVKKPQSDAERIVSLERQLRDLQQQVTQMQRVGGFADSRTIGIRCANMERRLDLLELDGEMVKDVTAHQQNLLEHHLRDRHDSDVDRDDAPDVIPWRRIRKRLREWADKRGLMTKRRDLTDARRDEGRVRPRQGSAVPA